LNNNSYCIGKNRYALHNFTFCLPWKKESHTGLERHEGEERMTEFSFVGELFLWVKQGERFCNLRRKQDCRCLLSMSSVERVFVCASTGQPVSVLFSVWKKRSCGRNIKL